MRVHLIRRIAVFAFRVGRPRLDCEGSRTPFEHLPSGDAEHRWFQRLPTLSTVVQIDRHTNASSQTDCAVTPTNRLFPANAGFHRLPRTNSAASSNPMKGVNTM